jgi:phosphorylase superfamily protein
MDTPEVTVIAATRLEAWAVRRALRRGRIIEAGVGLRRLGVKDIGEAVVSCGLAGAVRPGLPTGSVVIPKRVLRTDGQWVTCDPSLVDALVAASRELGLEPELGAIGTAVAIVRGSARESWAQRGCAAVDMETGLLSAPRIAAVRVILDTPERDLSEVWRRPASAFVRPESWREALWLLRQAPRCAVRAAAVVAAALRSYAHAPGRAGRTAPAAAVLGAGRRGR